MELKNSKYRDKNVVISVSKTKSGENYIYKIEEGKLPLIVEDAFAKAGINNVPKANGDSSYEDYYIRIVTHSARDILSGQASNKAGIATFAQEYLETDDSNDKYRQIPIVHITLADFYVKDMFDDLHQVQLPVRVPRSYQIMDSGIWNYIVPINGIKYEREDVTRGKRLLDVISSIYKNYEKGLYYLSIAHEYADLNARLVQESFLSGGHAGGVSPFIFHSEAVVEKMINREFRTTSSPDIYPSTNSLTTVAKIQSNNWRILLVDDKAFKGMKPFKSGKDPKETKYGDLEWNYKLTIIQRLMEKQFECKVSYRKFNKNQIECGVKENTIKTELRKSYLKKEFETFDSCSHEITRCRIRKAWDVFSHWVNNTNTKSSRFLICTGAKWILELKFRGNIKICRIFCNDYVKHICRICKVSDESVEINQRGNDIIEISIRVNEDFIPCSFSYLKEELEKLKTKYNSDDLIQISPKVNNGQSAKEEISPILIEYAESYKEAQDALKKKKYDIILLDYLLKEEKGKKESNRYGYELLEDIYSHRNDSTYQKGRGPGGKMFFMFISAYATAVSERLLAQGLNLVEDYWHISIGACPTNTPQLFLYNLIKLMELQLDHTGLDKLTPQNIYSLVNNIFRPKEKDENEESVRKRANANYQEVLSLHYFYRKMLKDINIPNGPKEVIFDSSGSVLITTFILHNVHLGGLLEHLIQFIHLTAFGTVRQWPEMWEEYLYFKDLFLSQNSLANQQEQVQPKEYKVMFDNINNYISKLKCSRS